MESGYECGSAKFFLVGSSKIFSRASFFGIFSWFSESERSAGHIAFADLPRYFLMTPQLIRLTTVKP
jgi:hypothetical protein